MRHEEQIKQGITNTLDEPVAETIKRDLNQIKEKLILVVMPLSQDSNDNVLNKLKEWDLWGPLIVCLALSTILSITAPSNSASVVFASVFVIVWMGAGAVSLNAQLLGGTISFFQSVCILGYCVFPLTISAAVCLIIGLFLKQVFVKLIFVTIGFIWSTRASVVFMTRVIKEERRLLAVYPVFFFYTFIAWLILLQ